MKKLQILKVWLEKKPDEVSDSSELGIFTDAPSQGIIIRFGMHKGRLASAVPDDEWPLRPREFRFFTPAMNGEQTGNPDSPRLDWERAEALERGEWGYVGIIAKAQIRNPDTELTQTIHSGGLWGIESDSSPDYPASVALEELDSLRAELETLGFGRRAIAYGFSRIEQTSGLPIKAALEKVTA